MGLLSAAVLTLSLACSPGGPDEAASPKAKPTASASAPPSAPEGAPSAKPSPLPPLKLDTLLDGKLTEVARQGETRGSAGFDYPEGQDKEGLLVVLMQCHGKGTLKISVKTMEAAYTLDCTDRKVESSAYEFNVGGTAKKGVVSVQASSGVRWSGVVGRS